MQKIFSLLLVCALFPMVACAKTAEKTVYEEGKHYKVISDAQATDKKEVIEYFMYSCPHCDALDPLVRKWLEKKPKGIAFRHVPVSFHDAARVHARAFYVAEKLEVTEQIHTAFFQAIHRQKNPLDTEDALSEFFEQHAQISAPAFRKAYYDFGVVNKIRQSERMAREHKVMSVPTFVVNGKYMTAPSMIKDGQDIFKVIEYLTTLK